MVVLQDSHTKEGARNSFINDLLLNQGESQSHAPVIPKSTLASTPISLKNEDNE